MALPDDLYDCIGCSIRVAGAMFDEPTTVTLLEVEPDRISVARDTGEEPIWLLLSEIRIG